MKQNQPRVLSVIGNLAIGGAESLLYYLHKHFKSKGYDNFTLCTLASEGDFYQKAKEEGLQVISLNLSSKRDPRAIPRLIKVIRDGQYNIVHSHLSAAALYSVMALLFLPNVRFIHTFHGIAPINKIHLSGRAICKLIGMKADRVISIGDEDKRRYCRIPSIHECKVSILPNAIESSVFDIKANICRKRDEIEMAHDDTVLLAVGRICEPKGYDNLLKSAKLLKGKNQKYKLIIAGDGPLWSEMNGLRDELGLQNEVVFLGRRKDIPELLSIADIFVQASKWEGISISIIEAMMCGKVIIATAVGGNLKLISTTLSFTDVVFDSHFP